jgi:cysteine-rich repeat protein
MERFVRSWSRKDGRPFSCSTPSHGRCCCGPRRPPLLFATNGAAVAACGRRRRVGCSGCPSDSRCTCNSCRTRAHRRHLRRRRRDRRRRRRRARAAERRPQRGGLHDVRALGSEACDDANLACGVGRSAVCGVEPGASCVAVAGGADRCTPASPLALAAAAVAASLAWVAGPAVGGALVLAQLYWFGCRRRSAKAAASPYEAGSRRNSSRSISRSRSPSRRRARGRRPRGLRCSFVMHEPLNTGTIPQVSISVQRNTELELDRARGRGGAYRLAD